MNKDQSNYHPGEDSWGAPWGDSGDWGGNGDPWGGSGGCSGPKDGSGGDFWSGADSYSGPKDGSGGDFWTGADGYSGLKDGSDGGFWTGARRRPGRNRSLFPGGSASDSEEAWSNPEELEDWGDFPDYPYQLDQSTTTTSGRKRANDKLMVRILAAALVVAFLGALLPRLFRGVSKIPPSPATPTPVTFAPIAMNPATPAPATPVPVTPAPVTPAPVTPTPVTPAPTPWISETPLPAAPTPDPAAAFVGDHAELYFRSMLDPSEQLIYDAICATVQAHEEKLEGVLIPLPERIYEIYDLVWRDRPDFFWIDGSSTIYYTEEADGFRVDFYPRYRMDLQQRSQMQTAVDAVRDMMVSRLQGCSDYEKVLGVYEYLIDNCVYQQNPLDYGMCSVLVDHYGVCNSYAKATQYLLQQLGVQVILVTGEAGGESHVWNIVRIDGDYYQLDTTWGDPIMDDGSQQKTFYYFCLTDAEMLRDHSPLEPGIYPACTAVEANWFRHEGRLIDRYDEAWLTDQIRRDLVTGGEVVFRCENESVYRQYCRELFEEGSLFRILENLGYPPSYSYSTNDSFFAIWFAVH